MRLVIGSFISKYRAYANAFCVLADESEIDELIDDMKTELTEKTGRVWEHLIARSTEYNDPTQWSGAIARFKEKAVIYNANKDIDLIRVRVE